MRSEWGQTESNQRARFYEITATGKEAARLRSRSLAPDGGCDSGHHAARRQGMKLWRRRTDDIDEEIANASGDGCCRSPGAWRFFGRSPAFGKARVRQSATGPRDDPKHVGAGMARSNRAGPSIRLAADASVHWILTYRHRNPCTRTRRDGSHVHCRQPRSASGPSLSFTTAAGLASRIRAEGRPGARSRGPT